MAPLPTAPPHAAAPKSDFTKVVSNGQHYAFPNLVAPAQYPDPCSVLSMASVEALLGGPATKAASLNQQCTWTQSGVSSLNAFQVSFMIDNVASEAAGDYATRMQTSSNQQPTPVAGIGQKAFTSSLNPDMTDPDLTVLTGQADFDIEIIPPGESTITGPQAVAIVTAAAKTIAPEFS
ncbi:MAG: hypothetical protein ACR2MN_12535 [Acidimicrobiales bacterium]